MLIAQIIQSSSVSLMQWWDTTCQQNWVVPAWRWLTILTLPISWYETINGKLFWLQGSMAMAHAQYTADLAFKTYIYTLALCVFLSHWINYFYFFNILSISRVLMKMKGISYNRPHEGMRHTWIQQKGTNLYWTSVTFWRKKCELSYFTPTK